MSALTISLHESALLYFLRVINCLNLDLDRLKDFWISISYSSFQSTQIPVQTYCTTLFAQFELANASGFALKAKPIPTI